jgi:hypothetical protein
VRACCLLIQQVHSFDLFVDPIIRDGQDPIMIQRYNIAEGVPLENESCDFVVFSVSLLNKDKKKCIQTAVKALKHSGKMIIVEDQRWNPYEELEQLLAKNKLVWNRIHFGTFYAVKAEKK